MRGGKLWLTPGIAALVLASCGGQESPTSTPASPQSNRAATSSAPHRCETKLLRILPAPGFAGAGNAEIPFAIFNGDHRRCSLYGFPRIGLLDESGKPVPGLEVKPSSADYFGIVPKRTVIVPIGGLASFRIADNSGPYRGTEQCPGFFGLKVAQMRVGFPPAPGAKLLRYKSSFCRAATTTVSPVAAKRSGY